MTDTRWTDAQAALREAADTISGAINLIGDQQEEIERLREEKKLRIDFKNMARELTERCDAQAQEIERLREKLTTFAESVAAQAEHDMDATLYGTECLHCTALKILDSTRPGGTRR